MYSEITALTNQEGYCWATNEYFANLYGVSPETVSRWISQLRGKEYFFTVTIPTKHGIERRIYLPDAYRKYIESKEGIDKKINRGIDKKVKTGIDKKIKHNKESINKEKGNKRKEESPPPNSNESFPEGLKQKPTHKAGGATPNYYQQFLMLFGVQDNHPLVLAWCKLESTHWQKIIEHLPGYLQRTSRQGDDNPNNLPYRANPLTYLKNFIWINNPNPAKRNKTRIPIVNRPKQIPA